MKYFIVSGKYETGTKQQQLGYNQLFGEDNTQSKFDMYFHWFNIIHELGHCLVDFKGVKMNSVEEELFVNCFAVQYWKNADSNGILDEVEILNKEILSKLPPMLPVDEDFYTFFNSIWGTEEMNNPMMYGYFQMLCVQQAFCSTKSLSELLEQIGYKQVDISLMDSYESEINAKNGADVLTFCLENLKKMGCEVPTVNLKLVDNPEVQCSQNA